MSSRPALPLRRLLLLAIFLWPLSATAVEWVGTVVGIADGDTLTLLDGGKTTHRIRIDGIDAPERTQPYGQRARKSLADLAHGRSARAECPKSDRYGRAVCRVLVDGVDVGLEPRPRATCGTVGGRGADCPVGLPARADNRGALIGARLAREQTAVQPLITPHAMRGPELPAGCER